MGCVPSCVPVVIAFVAVLEGSFAGSIFGLCLGLFSCLAQGGEGAGMIFLGAVIGMLAGLWQERKLRNPFFACLFSALAALLGVELVQILLQLLFASNGSLAAMGRIAAFETRYSILLAVPAYLPFRFVYRRLGSGG